MKKLITLSLAVLLAAPAMTQSLVLNSFKQGPQKEDGNCASVAVIKLAIAEYGVGKVFNAITRDSIQPYFSVRLRNDTMIRLTAEEVAYTIKASDFQYKL